MRPETPMAGCIRDQMMIGLSGNPVSAMVRDVFVKPVIDVMLGYPHAQRRYRHLNRIRRQRPRAHTRATLAEGDCASTTVRQFTVRSRKRECTRDPPSE